MVNFHSLPNKFHRIVPVFFVSFFLVSLLLSASSEDRKLIVQFAPVGLSGHQKHRKLEPFAKSRSIELLKKPIYRFNRTSRRIQRSVFDDIAFVDVKENMNKEMVRSNLLSDPNIIAVVSDEPVEWRGGMPNDPEFPNQWGLHNTGQLGGVEDIDIDAPEAWQITKGDPQIIVAVMDDGVDYTHPDLAANMWVNERERDGVPGEDDDDNGYVDDIYGYDFRDGDPDPHSHSGSHGTGVAAVIGAVSDNSLGMVGVAPKVRVMAVKFGLISGGIKSMHYAVDNGARILSNSWGLGGQNSILESVVNELDEQGILFIAAAANQGVDTVDYPPFWDGAFTVTAINNQNQRAQYIDPETGEVRGSAAFGVHIDVAGPGVDIVTIAGPDTYQQVNGTSFATPHVSGVAALLLSHRPELDNQTVKRILRATAKPVDSDEYVGTGLVNAYDALQVENPPPIAELEIPSPVIRQDEPLTFSGTASSPLFDRYILDYGIGKNPSSWITIYESKVGAPVVIDGPLFEDFDPLNFPTEGGFTVRLRVYNRDNVMSQDRKIMAIDLIRLDSPRSMDVLRKGGLIEVRGIIGRPSNGYDIAYGVGRNPSTWHRSGIQITHTGPTQRVEGVLATWDTSQLGPSTDPLGEFYRVRLTIDGDLTETVHYANYVYLDEKIMEGWPQEISFEPGREMVYHSDVKVADLDKNGSKEIVALQVMESGPSRLVCFGANGTQLWSTSVLASPDRYNMPVFGDIDGDGYDEILLAGIQSTNPRKDQIVAFNHDGSLLSEGWPVPIDQVGMGLVVADLNNDQQPEVIVKTILPDPAAKNGTNRLYVITGRGEVVMEREIPVGDRLIPSEFFEANVGSFRPELPAVGNFDDDSDLEIVVPSGSTSLDVINRDGTSVRNWPKDLGGNTNNNTFAIGDINQDGQDDIIVGVFQYTEDTRTSLNAIDRNGEAIPGWPLFDVPRDSFRNVEFWYAPALADFNRDGNLEIAVVGDNSIFIFDASGSLIPGWPQTDVAFSNQFKGITLADINGDEDPDIITASRGFVVDLLIDVPEPYLGGIFAWNFDGSRIDLNNETQYEQLISHSPNSWVVIDDIDGDDSVELITSVTHEFYFDMLTGTPQQTDTRFKNRSLFSVWDLESSVTMTAPWPYFQHDNQHTGYRRPPIGRLNVDAGPDQSVALVSSQGDGDVDGDDFLLWQAEFGAIGAALQADMNGDTRVDGEDFLIWNLAYGKRIWERGYDARADIDGNGAVHLKLSGTIDGSAVIPADVVVEWEQVAGPESVFFENANDLGSFVLFQEVGTYGLRLSVQAGNQVITDLVVITVEPSDDTNASQRQARHRRRIYRRDSERPNASPNRRDHNSDEGRMVRVLKSFFYSGQQSEIELSLKQSEVVQTKIRRARTSEIVKQFSHSFDPGTHTIMWDGRDSSGHKQSGVYKVAIQVGAQLFEGTFVFVE